MDTLQCLYLSKYQQLLISCKTKTYIFNRDELQLLTEQTNDFYTVLKLMIEKCLTQRPLTATESERLSRWCTFARQELLIH